MSTARISRRKFLTAGGAAAGTLVVAGGGYWVASGPVIALPEPSYSGAAPTGRKVLIAFASKAGSTAEVAAFVGRRLAEKGHTVDVRRVDNTGSLGAYDAVLVGSAVRAGHWLGEASEFVRANRDVLAQRPTAFFTLCMTLQQDTPNTRQIVADYLKPVRRIVRPASMGFFAGKMDYSRLTLVPRLIAKAIKVPEGDFRKWDAIDAWADSLQGELLRPA